jgi:hypothetical protein
VHSILNNTTSPVCAQPHLSRPQFLFVPKAALATRRRRCARLCRTPPRPLGRVSPQGISLLRVALPIPIIHTTIMVVYVSIVPLSSPYLFQFRPPATINEPGRRLSHISRIIHPHYLFTTTKVPGIDACTSQTQKNTQVMNARWETKIPTPIFKFEEVYCGFSTAVL